MFEHTDLKFKELFTATLLGLAAVNVSAQTDTIVKTQCGTPTGQERFPLYTYKELPQLTRPDSVQWKDERGLKASWGSKSVRYSATSVPVVKKIDDQILAGWKGERVFAQAVIWTARQADSVQYRISDLKGTDGSVIPAAAFETGFVRYVMADELNKDGNGGCGDRTNHASFDSSMVADCIDQHMKSIDLSPMQTQAVWLTCWIPQRQKAGSYTGTFTVTESGQTVDSLKLTVIVEDKILTYPEGWDFHLDLWQNPFAVARYYKLPLWSSEHIKYLKPMMRRLALAGQKVITTTITYRPWSGQTEDAFDSMVTWTKKADGSWEYGFGVFDKWVKLMMECGITQQINCYSMAPWNLTFRYLDEKTGTIQDIHTSPGEASYEELWVPFLKAFARHLKEKGWFDRTAIAMDERPVETMKMVIGIVRKADPDFKLSLAGSYYPEIEKDIFDYCIYYGENFPDGVIERRRAEGKHSTYYTCCRPAHPNTFTFSEPDEAAQIGYEIAARGADGYLRWAYNSWPLEPLLDSRFCSWASGDTFLIYPGNRSSIRFQRLIDGIQYCEKSRKMTDNMYLGLIKDESRNPVAGAKVWIKGTTVGTSTDATGRFAIETAPNNTLVITCPGYASKEITVRDQATEVFILSKEK